MIELRFLNGYQFSSCVKILVLITGLVACSVEVIQPFLLGCDTKNAKIVHQCLISIQRLISHEAISLVSKVNHILIV